MGSKTNLIVAGLLIAVAVVYLIVTATGDTASYFLTVEELQALDEEARERSVTVSGAVLGESIDYDPSLPRVSFTIVQVPADPDEVEAAGGIEAVLHAAVNDPTAPRLRVVHDGVKPEMLRNEAQAILRGRMTEEGFFRAEEILLKCPSRYEEALPEQSRGSLP